MLLSCGVIGFRVAARYRDRSRQIRSLTQGLRLLRADIEYSMTPLPYALEKIARQTEGPLRPVFEELAEQVRTGTVSVAEAFEVAAHRCRTNPALALQSSELEVLTEFGGTLGQSDRRHEVQNLDAALIRLEGLEQLAEESQRKNERLWQYLGVLGGLLVVVMLY